MSYGQQLLRSFLEAMIDQEFIENYRPDWMHGLELDFYFPGVQVAFEFQGDQHYVPAFGVQPWQSQQQRDLEKKELCKRWGVHLVCIDAVNLGYYEIYYQLKILKFRRVVMKQKHWDISLLTSLNQKAKEYRALLNANYVSPTVFRKKTEKRKEKLAAWGIGKPKPVKVKKPKKLGTLWHSPKEEFNVILTEALIEACRSDDGEFSERTLKAFYIDEANKEGWRERLVGMKIGKYIYEQALKGKRLAPRAVPC